MRFEDQRKRLIQILQTDGIKDELVLSAFMKVPRELFVPSGYRDYAYANHPLPISHNQTISQPLMIAIMLEELELKKSDRVLEIGTGSGYQTALLALATKEVYTVELIEELSLSAQKILKEAGHSNIHYFVGDGWKGWANAYPPIKEFDKIIVSAAADMIPEELILQLADGGIMVFPMGDRKLQYLHKVIKKGDTLQVQKQGACTFVPFVHP